MEKVSENVGFGSFGGTPSILMGVATDPQNILESMSPIIGGQENGGQTTGNVPHAQAISEQNTSHGSPSSEPKVEKPLSPTATPKARIQNLSALLARDNVDFIHVVRADTVTVTAKMGDIKDSKVYSVGDIETGGCFVLVHLTDNPAGVGDNGFYAIGGQLSSVGVKGE